MGGVQVILKGGIQFQPQEMKNLAKIFKLRQRDGGELTDVSLTPNFKA